MKRLLGWVVIISAAVAVVTVLGVREQGAIAGGGRDRDFPVAGGVDPVVRQYVEACLRTYSDSQGCHCLAGGLVRDFGSDGAKRLAPKVLETTFRKARVKDLTETEKERIGAIFSECRLGGAGDGPPPSKPAAAPRPEEDPRVWKTKSFDGAVTITQAPAGSGACLLEARRGDQLLWKSSSCAGVKVDYKFVSPKGDRLAVIYPLPTIESSVRSTPVMRVFKDGKQQYASAAAATVADWQKLKTGGSNFYWLAGALDAPGDAPRYTDSGAAFDFATVDGRKYHIDLTGQ